MLSSRLTGLFSAMGLLSASALILTPRLFHRREMIALESLAISIWNLVHKAKMPNK